MPGGPPPARDPCDDAAIEPANGAPKKGLAYRRAPAGLGRLRREPDPCVRRRSGAGTHSARGCMGPAEFGNAGLPPWKTLSLCFATLIFRFSRLIFFGFHVSRQGRTANFPNLRTCPS